MSFEFAETLNQVQRPNSRTWLQGKPGSNDKLKNLVTRQTRLKRQTQEPGSPCNQVQSFANHSRVSTRKLGSIVWSTVYSRYNGSAPASSSSRCALRAYSTEITGS